MNLADALPLIESLAPKALAESWDPVGLHVGAQDWPVSRGLVTIDLTKAVLEEAAEKACDLIVSYHPPIFKAIERLTDQDWGTQRILSAARQGIAVYSPHTALDAAEGGVCDWLCDQLAGGEAADRRPIAGKQAPPVNHKLVVFVPLDAQDAVREAMSRAGAGWIGNYRECSFSAAGTGGFRPLKGANPAIGTVGQRQTVAESRLEMIVPAPRLAAVVAAVRHAHPYEEPALDIFKLEPEPGRPTAGPGAGGATGAAGATGAGRLLTLKKTQTVTTLAQRLKALLGVDACRVVGGDQAVQTIAVCPGAGGSLFAGVDADLYITGEMRHHEALDYQQRGKAVLLAGHTNTERPYLPVYAARLTAAVRGVGFEASQADVCPWKAG